MGSSGTNRFSDYPGSSGGGGGGGGGSGGVPDKCVSSISVELEDVATSDYFVKHGEVPKPKTSVRVRLKLVGGRVAVETISSNEVIGNLPTTYNYVRRCSVQGWKYEGIIVASSSGKLPKIKVDLGANK